MEFITLGPLKKMLIKNSLAREARDWCSHYFLSPLIVELLRQIN